MVPRQGAWSGTGTRILHNLLSRVPCQAMDGHGQTPSTPLSQAPPDPEHRHLQPRLSEVTLEPRLVPEFPLGPGKTLAAPLGPALRHSPPCRLSQWSPRARPNAPLQHPCGNFPAHVTQMTTLLTVAPTLWTPCSWLPPLPVALASPPDCRRGLSLPAAALPS